MRDIYVLGSINMDLVFHIPRMPKKGETLKSEGFDTSPGGKGANQAVAAARQGARSFMLGSIGDDAFSDQLEASLKRHGVGTTHLTRVKGKTAGNAAILLEGGDNRIVIDAGANAHPSEATIERAIEDAREGDILLAQLEIPLDAIARAFAQAKGKDLFTVLNAAPAAPLSDALYASTDLLVVNEGEAEMLSGVEVEEDGAWERAWEVFSQKGVQRLLITLGEKGSVYRDAERQIVTEAYVVETVDTTAAGDAYIGALAAELAQDERIETALDHASAAAALATKRKGAQEALPSRSDVEAFKKERDA